jgi:hypothetical protein
LNSDLASASLRSPASPCRDSLRVLSTSNDMEEHGRHCKSLEVHHGQRYCVSRCVSRLPNLVLRRATADRGFKVKIKCSRGVRA